MKVKLIGIFVSFLLILTVFNVSGMINIIDKKSDYGTGTDYQISSEDYLDQKMIDLDKGYPFNIDNYGSLAQSFIPRMPVLTKVEIFIYRSPGDQFDAITLSIRKNLNEDDLTKVTKSSDMIPLEFDMRWIEFDFCDISVIPGEEYFMVGYLDGEKGSYHWIESMANPYYFGEKWEKYEDTNWMKKMSYDLTFKTYSKNKNENRLPNIPTVNGKFMGKIGEEYDYTFISSDPDGDSVYYYVDWDEYINTQNCYSYTWTGLTPSNVRQNASFNWIRNGYHVVRVKAVDEFGYESDYARLIIEMSKNKLHFPYFDSLFNYFFERVLGVFLVY